MSDAATSPPAALAARVARGEVPREALEALSLLGDGTARRALGLLPLLLSASPPELEAIDEGAGYPSEKWLAAAGWLAPFGRRACVAMGLAALELTRHQVARDEEPPASAHLGLYTGPFGVVDLTEPLVREVFPLTVTLARTRRAVRAWLETEDDALAADLARKWPELLGTYARVELLAELAGLDPRLVWACGLLVRCVAGDPKELGASVAMIATLVETTAGDREATREALREVLARVLSAPRS